MFSGYHLIQTALDLKSQYKGGIQDTTTPVELMQRRPEFWDIPPVSMFLVHFREHTHIPDEWASEKLEMENMLPSYTFPPLDLVESLAKHYFTQINPFLPLLHRPTFKRGVDENLHLTDQCFGAVVLLVCALGSRYSEDSRVFVEGSNSVRSAGWKWFGQIRILRTSFFKQTSLHELQAYAVCHSAWIFWFIIDWIFAIALHSLLAVVRDTARMLESSRNGTSTCSRSRCSSTTTSK